MNKHVRFVVGIIIALGAQMLVSSAAAQGRNTIYGTIFGEGHRAVPDVYVELLDEVDSVMRQARSDPGGRFSFSGLQDGRYRIRVRPYGTDYKEQMQEVVLASVSSRAGSGSDTQHIDILLKVSERAYSGPFAMAPTTVFAQSVPEGARRLYEEGVRYLRDKKEKEGLESLKKAIEVFPEYYLALDRLGAEYAMRGTSNPAFFQAGLVLLMKAVEINSNGFSSLFGLGWTQYQLGMNAEAIENLRRATALYTKSADVYLWLGRALRRGAVFDQAEAALKRANELSGGKVGEVHRQLSGLYLDQKRYREAADELELVLKNEPKATDAEKIKELIKTLREKAGTK
jgi:tetratricopeptide (TPR) repeat protein